MSIPTDMTETMDQSRPSNYRNDISGIQSDIRKLEAAGINVDKLPPEAMEEVERIGVDAYIDKALAEKEGLPQVKAPVREDTDDQSQAS